MMHQPITAAHSPEEAAAIRKARPLYEKIQALRLEFLNPELEKGQRARVQQEGTGLREKATAIAESIGWTEIDLERACVAALQAEKERAGRRTTSFNKGPRPKSVLAAGRSLSILNTNIERAERELEAACADRAKARELAAAAKGPARERLEARAMNLSREISRINSALARKRDNRAELLRIVNGEGA